MTMTSGLDAFILGKLDGEIKGKVFDPPSHMSSADKEQYRKGFYFSKETT